MDYSQLGLIILVLLAVLGWGMLLNGWWIRHKNNKKASDAKGEVPGLPDGYYRDIWNNSSMGLLLTNVKGNILTINPFLVQLAGNSSDLASGKSIEGLFGSQAFMDLFHSLLLPQLREVEDKGVFMDLNVLCQSSANELGVFASWVPAVDTAEKNILLVFLDMPTQLKSSYGSLEVKQQTEEARKLKTNFLSSMSHEIRTPLNGILGTTANIILRNSHNRELVDQLEIISLSGERLLNTINSILDMSKIVANKMEVLLEKTNVNDFLSKLLIPYKSLAIKKDLLLTVKYETRPFIAKIDRKYFELIVTNIVENAVKYSERGLIKITLKRQNDNLHLCVQDDGIGISEEYLKKLFNLFEQESFGYNREFEGSGIGLTITKKLIDLLHGEIRIESIKGKGTLVTVILPLVGTVDTIEINK